LRLSTRNQLSATVTEVRHGEVTTIVKVRLGDGQTITSSITKEAAEELDLAPGDEIVVLIKSSEVMLGKE
jgi:molybdate transport system regulatory protein